jgi:hypothetical protein
MSILNNKWKGVNLAMLIIISASLILSAAVSAAAPVVAAKQYTVKSITDEDGEDAKSEENKLAKDDNDDNKGKDGEDAKSEENKLAKDDNDDNKGKDGEDAKSEETELSINCNSDEEADDNSTEDSDVPCVEQSAGTEALNATTTTMITAPVSVFG